jgi:hypothetical protein
VIGLFVLAVLVGAGLLAVGLRAGVRDGDQ